MERRKLLIGGGAAFATALAGCTGSDSDDTEEEEPEETEDTEEDEPEEEADFDDVPGYEVDDLEVDSDSVTIDDVTYDDAVVSITASTSESDPESLYDELETLGGDLAVPTGDIDDLKGSVDVMEFTVYDEDDDELAAFEVEPIWIYQYMNDDLTEGEFLDAVLETAD